MIRSCLSGPLGALLWLGGAASSPAAEVERAVQAPGPGRVVVTLDREVYERARRDLGDLRVLDDSGAEVPYLLERVADEPDGETRRPAIRNRAFVRGQKVEATLDFEHPALRREVTLRLSGDNFRRRVKVEGRAGDPEWVTLTDTAYVFAVPGDPPARYETVTLPENNFPLLRVTVFHGPDDPPRVEILDAWARVAQRRRPREVALVPRMTRTEDAQGRETILTLDLGARHQPFRAVRLDVGDPTFFRGVLVEARVDPPPSGRDGQGLPLAWSSLGEGALYRYPDGGGQRENLRLEVSGRERVLRLRIRNRSDRPLDVRGAVALVPVERLAFEVAPGRAYRLRYGDPRVMPPSYDLARTSGDPALWAAHAQEARLEAALRVPEAPPKPPAWTERHPALLWTGLVAVVTALGAVTWRALRTAG